MEVRVLQNFLVVAREQNITRAAESLHIAQSSLSKQLMDLERELGKLLFIRGKRKLTLTEDGTLLRKRAEEIVSLMEKTRQEIASGAAEINGRISIGGAPQESVLQAAAQMRKKHPGVQFDFYASDATDVMERLDHGSLDFAVLLEPVNVVKYEFLSLGDSACWGLLLPSSCALAQKNAVHPDDLRLAPLVFHRREGLLLEIARWARTEPERLPIAATYNVVGGAPVHFVRSGLGYFLTTEDHLGSALPSDVCFLPLEPRLEIHHALVWKRRSVFSKVAKTFLTCFRKAENEGNHGETTVE